jgi:hypothetical protein
MSNQPFTRNHSDHSNDSGFQFEFHCDHCGNGYRSTFKPNALGIAAELLKAAGSIFGGHLSSAGWGAGHVKDAFRGPAWDAAFREAVDELRPKFHQCTRCGKWVCPEVCWNSARGLCEECAPDMQEQVAAVQAQVAVEQLWDKARQTDQTAGMEVGKAQAATCAHCKATLQANARFCASCGKAAGAAAKAFCVQCGGELAGGARFCGGCGTAVQA